MTSLLTEKAFQISYVVDPDPDWARIEHC